MPKVSRETAVNVQEMGPTTTDRWSDLGGYRAEFVNVGEDTDLTPLLQGLPNDQCQCPHWGYVFAGRMWFRNGDSVEEFGPGDAFYVPAGHTAGADQGSEFLVISPEELIADLEQHMMKRAQQLQGAHQS